MKPFRRDTILLVVANPVDLLTSIAKDIAGLPASQVIGSGTFLDTYRLRGMLATRAFVSLCDPLSYPHHFRLTKCIPGLPIFHRYQCCWCSRRRPSCCLVKRKYLWSARFRNGGVKCPKPCETCRCMQKPFSRDSPRQGGCSIWDWFYHRKYMHFYSLGQVGCLSRIPLSRAVSMLLEHAGCHWEGWYSACPAAAVG